MGQLVFQATLGGQVNLVGPNTASTLNINVPAFAGTMASLASVTANGVNYVNSSGQPTSGSGFVFDGANVGIGVTPSAWSGYRALQIGGTTSLWSSTSGNASSFYTNNGYYNGANRIYLTTGYATEYIQGQGQHIWYNAPSGTAGNTISFTQAMTLDSSGNLLLGTTNATQTAGLGIKMVANATGYFFAAVTDQTTNGGHTNYHLYSTGAGAYRFYVGAGGTIFATSTTISSLSDVRHKENIRDLDVGLAEIMQLQPRVFDWKEGKGKNIQNDRGFIAQEVEQVFPDLIDEWKDPAPEGEEPYKSVRQDLIPVLVKAIQELKALVDTQASTITQLQADVAALKVQP